MGGKITIHGKVNHLDLQTHGADIELDDADQLRAETMAARLRSIIVWAIRSFVTVAATFASMLRWEIGDCLSGRKYLAQGDCQGPGTIGRGNIEVVRCAGSLMVRTAGGNINLGEMAEPSRPRPAAAAFTSG